MTLLVSFLHTLSAGNLPGDGLTGVVRHGETDRNLHVLGHLHRHLLAHLLRDHLALPRHLTVAVVGGGGGGLSPQSTWQGLLNHLTSLRTASHHNGIIQHLGDNHRGRWRDRFSYGQGDIWTRSPPEINIEIPSTDPATAVLTHIITMLSLLRAFLLVDGFTVLVFNFPGTERKITI